MGETVIGNDGVATRTTVYESSGSTLVETAVDTAAGETVAVCETDDGASLVLAVDDPISDPDEVMGAGATLTPAEARRLGSLLTAWADGKQYAAEVASGRIREMSYAS